MPWAVITLFVFSLLMSSVIVRELWICVRRKKYQKVLVKIQDMSDEEIDKLYKQMKLNPLNSLCDMVNNLSKLPNAVDTQVPSEAEATQTQSLIQSEQEWKGQSFEDKEQFQQKYESHNIKMESYESDQDEEIKESD
eukprot:403369657